MSFLSRRVAGKGLLETALALFGRVGPSFECPLCGYQGKFSPVFPASGLRKFARCPQCGSLERHRLQFLVIDPLLRGLPCAAMAMLHIAPEPFFVDYFRRLFGRYDTADLYMEGVDHRVDLAGLPFLTGSYDFVFASHVLEHIRDDMAAIAEIRRVLKPGGIAVLPVPLLGGKTIEYPEPNPAESFHVRAPGYDDYFNRYRRVFDRVSVMTSDMFPEKYQLYIYEDRSRFPTRDCPWREPVKGKRHVDAVPVCHV